jgi:hypothetical protein
MRAAKRWLAILLLFCLAWTCTGCGNVFVRGVINPGSSSISG